MNEDAEIAYRREISSLREEIRRLEEQMRKYRSALEFADVVARLAKGKDPIVDDRIQMYTEYRKGL